MSGHFLLRATLAGFCFCFCGVVVLPTSATAGGGSPKTARVVGGNMVSLADQKRLGLVSLSNDCSGTLVNSTWVLTTDHCVGSGVAGGPDFPFASLQITAEWAPGVSVAPAKYVRYFASDKVDVALIQLATPAFGWRTSPYLTSGQLPNGAKVVQFGRGLFTYAMAGPPAVPGQTGQYHSAQLNVTNSGGTISGAITFTLPANGAGQVGDGGDSGGATFLTDVNGVPVSIAGVQSGCHFTACLPRQTCQTTPNTVDWKWVTNIDQCWSGPIFNIRDKIIQTIHPVANMVPVEYLLEN